MRSDRLRTVQDLRARAEKARLAEQARAQRAAVDAVRAQSAALAARAALRPTAGTTIPAGELRSFRTGGVALGEAVERATDDVRASDAELIRADEARVHAAVARRSVDRLAERRAELRDAEQLKVEIRRGDEVALQVWRRR